MSECASTLSTGSKKKGLLSRNDAQEGSIKINRNRGRGMAVDRGGELNETKG